MGKDVGFTWLSESRWPFVFEKSDVLPRDIKYKVDVQTSKLVNDETKYGVFDIWGHNESVHEESISQIAAINPSDARKRRVVPLGRKRPKVFWGDLRKR